MTAYTPYTRTATARIGPAEPAFTDPAPAAEANANPNDDLAIPHALDVLVQVRAAAVVIEGMCQQAQRMLRARPMNPLNVPVAEAIMGDIEKRVHELRLYAEIG